MRKAFREGYKEGGGGGTEEQRLALSKEFNRKRRNLGDALLGLRLPALRAPAESSGVARAPRGETSSAGRGAKDESDPVAWDHLITAPTRGRNLGEGTNLEGVAAARGPDVDVDDVSGESDDVSDSDSVSSGDARDSDHDHDHDEPLLQSQDASVRAARELQGEVASILTGLPAPNDPRFTQRFAASISRTPGMFARTQSLTRGAPGGGCAGEISLHPHQRMFYAHMTHVAKTIEANLAGDRWTTLVPKGVLGYHSTGSGKTSVTMGIIDAFHDLIKHHGWRIYFLTTGDNVKNNNVDKFAEHARHYPHFAGMDEGAALKRMRKDLKLAPTRFTGGKGSLPDSAISYDHASVRNRMQKGEISLRRNVVVLDEGQNLLDLKTAAGGDSTYRKPVYDKLVAADTTFVIILTATPGKSAEDVVKLMRLLSRRGDRPPLPAYEEVVDKRTSRPRPEGLARFQRFCASRVSFMDMRGVRTMFPAFDVVVERVGMTAKHAEQMRKRLREKDQPRYAVDVVAKLDMAQNRALRKAQKTSSVPWSNHVLPKSCACKDGGSTKMKCPKHGGSVYARDLEQVSMKVLAAVRNIARRGADKHYVYTKYKETANVLACALTHTEQAQLGEPLSREIKKQPAWLNLLDLYSGKLPEFEHFRAIARKRGKRIMIPLYEVEKEDQRAIVGKLWNHADNQRGGVFHVMIGADKQNEGVDLKDTRVIHQMEALLTVADVEQLDGRGVRTCSLKRFPHTAEDQRVSKIIYHTVAEREAAEADLTQIAERVRLAEHRLEQLAAQLTSGPADVASLREGVAATEADTAAARELALAALREHKRAEGAGGSKAAFIEHAQAYFDKKDALEALRGELARAVEELGPKVLKRRQKETRGELKKLRAEEKRLGAANLPSVDEIIQKAAAERYVLLETLYAALRQSAVDCEPLLPLNSITHPHLSCGVRTPPSYEAIRARLMREK